MEWAIGIGAGLLFVIAALMAWGHTGYRKHARKLQRIARELANADPVKPQRDLDDLPEPARRLLKHAIGESAKPACAVRLTFEGEIRPGRNASWMPFEATEVLRPPEGLTWRARLKGAMKLSGGDHYYESDGGVHFWLYRIFHAVKSRGTDVVRSAAGRVALEAFWFPPALAGDHVEWLEAPADIARCRMKVGDEAITMDFRVDDDGRIRSVSGERWGNDTEDHKWQAIPFGGELTGEATFDGYTIPTEFLIGWWFGTRQWADGQFMHAKVTDAEFIG